MLQTIKNLITILITSTQILNTLPTVQFPYVNVSKDFQMEEQLLVPIDELRAIEATAYCVTGTCADGTWTREGITAAMAKEYIGCVAYVWSRNEDGSVGEPIGKYEIHDTGGDYRIKNGTVIDIYIPSYDDAIQFGRQDVYVYLVFPED